MFRPYEGLRVLDLSRLLPGPFLTQMLAEWGADVIKVEQPNLGDYSRWIDPFVEGVGYSFAAVNRGKRSIAIDLKAAGASQVVLRLASQADVFVETFRPGVLDRLGLSDAALAAANPALVRVSLVGYPEGPRRDEAGHDLTYEAEAGLLDITGHMPAIPMADMAGALYGAAAVGAALAERARTGAGQRVEIALSEAARAVNALPFARSMASQAAGEDAPARGSWELAGGLACYHTYTCADGRDIALGALEPKFWDAFLALLSAEDAATVRDLQMRGDPAAFAAMRALFAKRSAHDWASQARKVDAPLAVVATVAEAAARGPASPGSPAGGTAPTTDVRVPALGAHSDEVLQAAGWSRDEIDALVARGVVARADSA